MPVQLFIFRHGETDWNFQKKFQGHTNIPLNQKGRDQAHVLREKIRLLSPEICLCSDLDRASETAKIALQDFQLPFLYSNALRETHLGDVEGLTQTEIIDRYGETILHQWRSIDPADINMSFPNGETKIQHLKRLKKHISEFVTLNPNWKKIAVSTHGGALFRLVHDCDNAPEQAISIPNCCLYEIHYFPETSKWEFIKYHE